VERIISAVWRKTLRTWFDPHTCRVIAEVGQNHDGSLGAAHAFVDSAAKAGADAIKFQTHIAAAESTLDEPWRVKFSLQDATRYEYWKRMEFTEEQWRGLAEHAASAGILFFASPFSIPAVELLDRIGVRLWKIGAGEITNLPMIERIARTRHPVLLSSGLSSWADLDIAVATVRRCGAPVGVFQCTTAYPCPPEKLGLNVLRELRDRYRCPVGLSDHSGEIYSGLAAAALGANMIEVHVTFSRECFGPDVCASITTAELAQLIAGVRFIEKALANPVDKEGIASELAPLRRVFGKSVIATRDLPAGRRLAPDDLALKKPGTGIPPGRMPELVNCTLKRAVAANCLLSDDDLESN
jgi:N,N'-diacetyllegionaminate synthase